MFVTGYLSCNTSCLKEYQWIGIGAAGNHHAAHENHQVNGNVHQSLAAATTRPTSLQAAVPEREVR